jgi:uncharacterized protein (DUF433 family)
MKTGKSVVAAFSEDQASRLSGVSQAQLRYWDKTDFFRPSLALDDRNAPFSRVYSFRDLINLKALNSLRNDYGVSLPHLRDVRCKLGTLPEAKWAATTLYVINKRVVWVEPGTVLPQEVASGQYVASVVLSELVAKAKCEIESYAGRSDAKRGKIERHRYIAHNAPVVAGTRIPVSAIKRFVAAGYGKAQIVREYPSLTEEDIDAALAYEDSKKAA